ncbi:uncharacterized protein CDAR_581031 [Caerostris darwini]|uniref:Transposase IS30-like HTH domain-containing protein n=1 Tax=Caerostris darwini TaxID=1538125 RepID=A0AAV4WQP1_9ARAC|nr:uncharacterized protein CDAR_581031 [Caerostris darwini]
MDLKGKEITPEERKIIIKLRNEGKTLREIGKIVERTHSSIQRVINNYTSSKSIISKPRSGCPSKLTAREKRYVFKSHAKVRLQIKIKMLSKIICRRFRTPKDSKHVFRKNPFPPFDPKANETTIELTPFPRS